MVVSVVAVLAAATAPNAASAAPATAILDSSDVTLAAAADGGWSADVGVTNATDGPVTISPVAKSSTCVLTVGAGTRHIQLPRARHTTVAVSIPAACEATHGLAFVLLARAPGGRAAQSLPVVAAPATAKPAVFWSSLLSFLGAFGVALLVVLGIVLVWSGRTSATEKRAFTSLSGLDATWSFGDSIVSNLTAASGLVAIVLGSSDFLKAVLGEEAESAIAVATIAGSIALALVGAAGVLLLTLKKPSETSASILGLCCGSTVALAAAGGQVWTITLLLNDLDLGGAAIGIVWAACIAASLLLAGYAVISIYGLLEHGTKRQPTPDPLASPLPVEVVAAAVLAAANDGDAVTHATVTELLTRLTRPDGDAEQHGELMKRHVRPTESELVLSRRSALP